MFFSSNYTRSRKLSTGSSFRIIASRAVSRSLNLSMNVNLLDILFVIKLDNKRCTSVCNALYTEAKVECEYLKALDDSMIPVWYHISYHTFAFHMVDFLALPFIPSVGLQTF